MLEYKGEKRQQIADMLDGMSAIEEVTGWVVGWAAEWGVNGQIGLCNTLYRIAQQRGFIVGQVQTLGEIINIDQNSQKQLLTERQAAAIARDIFPYRGR